MKIDFLWTVIMLIVLKLSNDTEVVDCNSEDCLNSLRFNVGTQLTWPSKKVKCDYIASGNYVATNIIHTRAQMCGEKAVMLSPRYKSGIPYTLGEISINTPNKCDLSTKAYPCWKVNCEGDCDAIQNAVDIYMDCQGILWVLDTGIVNTIESPVKRCGPKVIGFHCESGRASKYVQLSSLIDNTSRLQFITADYSTDGSPFLYISDAGTRALLVWDVLNNRGFRVLLPKFLMHGKSARDVLYLALIRSKEGGSLLYFTYLSSQRMYYVQTDLLQHHNSTGCIMDVGRKPGRLVVLGTDNGSVLFFRLHGESDIYMWNTELPFKSHSFVLAQKSEDCRVATHVFPGYNKYMWVMESNFQDFLEGNVGCMGVSTSIHPLRRPANV